MPELPEVETSLRGIRPHIEGQQVVDFIVRQPKLRWPVPIKFVTSTCGKTIHTAERRGKYIKLCFDHGYWLVHLGMSGSLRIIEDATQPLKHDHVDLVLSNQKILRFNDPRRFGCWLFQPGNQLHPLLQQLGPEPLTIDFNAEYLYQLAKQRKVAVKTFIMNSQVVVGVGNIYASESLFIAGIDPRRQASRISLKRYGLLVNAIKTVLKRSINQGGTTLRDFVSSDGKPGYFKQQLCVYDRAHSPCLQCKTLIKKITQQQRSTYFCPCCQK